MSNDYKTASGFSDFVAGIGWISILVSGGLIFWLVEQGGIALIGVPAAFVCSLVGLILVVSGQSLRAQLDTANYTKKLLEIAKDNQG